MADLKLDFFYVETYDVKSFAIMDASVYSLDPVTSPKITICIPGFGDKEITFIPLDLNIFNSTILGITEEGCEQELPDGLYTFKYCVLTSDILHPLKKCVEKSLFRVNKLQERFDNAFLKLEIAECDGALKAQELLNLNTINAFIQTAIASANNCSEKQAIALYRKANTMLDRFLASSCGCH